MISAQGNKQRQTNSGYYLQQYCSGNLQYDGFIEMSVSSFQIGSHAKWSVQYRKGLRTFQTCSHRTSLISFALGACLGPAASNAWQEMSQFDGGRSLAFLVGFVPISEWIR